MPTLTHRVSIDNSDGRVRRKAVTENIDLSRDDEQTLDKVHNLFRGWIGPPVNIMSRPAKVREWDRRLELARNLAQKPISPEHGLITRERFLVLQEVVAGRADAKEEAALIRERLVAD